MPKDMWRICDINAFSYGYDDPDRKQSYVLLNGVEYPERKGRGIHVLELEVSNCSIKVKTLLVCKCVMAWPHWKIFEVVPLTNPVFQRISLALKRLTVVYPNATKFVHATLL